MKQPIVTVFGSSNPGAGSPAYQLAYDLGRALALSGWTVCNGGYGGTMEASARGAVEAGGHTIGVTCLAFGRSGPNAFIQQEIPTFHLLVRLDTLVRLGRAYIVLPGGTGTLLELALVWELRNKRLLRRAAPLLLLGSHWQPLVDTILLAQPEATPPQIVHTVEEVVEVLRPHFQRRQSGDRECEAPPGGAA